MQTFLTMGGRFVLSDDCHAVEQVALNYHRVFEFIAKAGITELFYCQPGAKAFGGVSAVEFTPTAVSAIEGWS